MEWKFDILDGATGPLTQIDAMFAKIEHSITNVDTSAKKLTNGDILRGMGGELGRRGDPRLAAPDFTAAGDTKRETEAKQESAKANAELMSSGAAYGNSVKKVVEELERLAKQERLQAAMAIEDPTKKKIAMLQIYRDNLKKTNEEQEKANNSLNLSTMTWVSVGRAALDAGKAVMGFAKSLLHTGMEESAFEGSTLRMLETLLGSRDAAKEELETLESMARGTKLTKEEMLDEYSNMYAFTEKFGSKSTHAILAASEDINISLGSRGAAAKAAFLEVVKQSAATGRFDTRNVRSLKQLPFATPEKVYELLASQRGVTVARIKKLMAQGKITDVEGIEAVQDLIQKNLNHGQAAGAKSAGVAAGSYKTQIKNLGEAWDSLFKGLNLKPLASIINRLSLMLDPETVGGKLLADDISRAFELITSVLKFGADNFLVLEAAVSITIETIRGIGLGLEWTGNLLGDIVWECVNFGNTLQKWSDSFQDFGDNIVKGLWTGLKNAWSGFIDDFRGLIQMLPNSVKKVLGIASPSKVMGALGANAAMSFGDSFERVGPPDVSHLANLQIPGPRFTDVMIPAPKFTTYADLVQIDPSEDDKRAQYLVGSMGGYGVATGGGDTNVTITINASGANAAAQWADIAPQVREEFIRIAEGL